MGFDYPPEFPPDARRRVALAIEEADCSYEESQKHRLAAYQRDGNRVTCVVVAAVVFATELMEVVNRSPTEWTSQKASNFRDDWVTWRSLSVWKSTRDGFVSLTPGDVPIERHEAFKEIVHENLVRLLAWTNLELTLKALGRDQHEQTAGEPASASSEQLIKRSEWLRGELDRRQMSIARLRTLDGPDRKTVRKILNAEPVTENVLRKLVVGLSGEKPPVRRDDIP